MALQKKSQKEEKEKEKGKEKTKGKTQKTGKKVRLPAVKSVSSLSKQLKSGLLNYAWAENINSYCHQCLGSEDIGTG